MSALLAPEFLPFTGAFLLMLALVLIEFVALLLGASSISQLDGLLPDMPDLPDPNGILDWLYIGRVPMLMLLILFLGCFSILGLGMQLLLHAALGMSLPIWLSWLPAILVSLPVVRVCASVLARILPRDESMAVSQDSLVGRGAVVVTGQARKGFAAQARVKDEHGRDHWVLVEPDVDGHVLVEGESILLVRMAGARYYAIRNPQPELIH